jgi:octaprenyl-diphosphate synthase
MRSDYTARLEKIEAVLQNALPVCPDAAWFRTNFAVDWKEGGEIMPPAFPSAVPPLLEPAVDLLGRGGKRWRPLLMLLVCESLGGGEAALPLSPLVEFCHNASLIHDDIEDNSACRRGKPAVHLLYGTDTAINSGCFLYFLPLSCIDGWSASAEAKLALYSLWAREMRTLHLGQSLDIAWHRDWKTLPSVDDYYAMCALKTGVLARFAANAGIMAAACAADRPYSGKPGSAALAKAAERMGVGFQILDDVKNLTEGVPGKKRGDDIVEGKKSLPLLLYLHGAASSPSETESRWRFVTRCIRAAATDGIGAPEAEELIAALAASGCLDKAAATGRSLLSQSEEVFSAIGGENAPLSGFTSLIA